MSTDTVVVPDTENVPDVKVRVASVTQNGRPTVPPLEDEELLLDDELLEDEELLLEELLEELLDDEEPQQVNCSQAVSIAPAPCAIVK
jgi:hypothetical protein